jgi:hypothetical protein
MSNDQVQRAHNILNEYNDRIDEAYALNLDALTGMKRWADFFHKQQEDVLKDNPNWNGPKTIQEMDLMNFHYGEGDANTSDAVVLHESTQGEVKARNQQGGANERAMSRVLLITIYQFWEDHYRSEFAKSIGKSKNYITSDFFGDIRHIRNGIVHHRNLATAEIDKCKCLKIFKPNQEIHLTSDQAKLVIQSVRQALDEISLQYLEIDGNFTKRIGGSGHRRI